MTSKVAVAVQAVNVTAFASLRLFGDDLAPEEISRLLGMKPTESSQRGLVTVSPTGKRRTAPTGRWILSTEGQVHATDLADHVQWLLDRLDEARVTPLNLPRVTKADVFCYWEPPTGQGGLEFSPELLARLAQHGLTLGIDVYSK